MSELDKLLIKLNAKKTGDLKNTEKIRITDDLKIKKIAFDVYKVYKDHYDGLWTMYEEDGEKYLIRSSSPEFNYTKNGDWSVASDYEQSSVTVNYKNVPIFT